MPTGKIIGSLRAKVVKKSDRINKFMNIQIEDAEKEQIQCCFFGEEVEKYKDLLVYG